MHSRPLSLSWSFCDGNKKPGMGHHRSVFMGKKLRDHSESDHPVARCGLSRPRTPFQVRPSLYRPLCLSSGFWDGTKKPSLGRHRSAFVGKKLRDHKELDHPVARYGLSRPRTPFQVRPSLSRPLCLSSAFWDGTKKPSLGRHRSAFVGRKLRDHSESDHPEVRCELSTPPTTF